MSSGYFDWETAFGQFAPLFSEIARNADYRLF